MTAQYSCLAQDCYEFILKADSYEKRNEVLCNHLVLPGTRLIEKEIKKVPAFDDVDSRLFEIADGKEHPDYDPFKLDEMQYRVYRMRDRSRLIVLCWRDEKSKVFAATELTWAGHHAQNKYPASAYLRRKDVSFAERPFMI